jgi:UDP-N-acetylmuramate dehydrogenase
MLDGFLRDRNIKFEEYADLSRLTSMRSGGVARFLLEPDSNEALTLTIRHLRDLEIKYRVVGGMTNTLPPDGLYDGAIVRTSRIDSILFTENNTVKAETGAPLARIARDAAERGVSGFAEFAGIPGTIGGAVYGNAGAHSVSVSDVIASVDAYDPISDRILVLDRDEMRFAYRDSLFKSSPSLVILSATLAGGIGEPNDIMDRMREYAEIRRARQPLGLPSLGSVFKHPSGDFAPRLIETLGLKGLTVGGASVSEKHAGFIVNNGTATSSDVVSLIAIIKERVLSAYGIELEEEINVM